MICDSDVYVKFIFEKIKYHHCPTHLYTLVETLPAPFLFCPSPAFNANKKRCDCDCEEPLTHPETWTCCMAAVPSDWRYNPQSLCRRLFWKLVKPLAAGSHRCDGGRQSQKWHTTLPRLINTDLSVCVCAFVYNTHRRLLDILNITHSGC